MREIRLLPPELGLIAVTRGMLGLGIGLLISERIRKQHRRRLGAVLAGIGALSTIPLGVRLLRRRRAAFAS
jgi:hypothetical protein